MSWGSRIGLLHSTIYYWNMTSAISSARVKSLGAVRMVVLQNLTGNRDTLIIVIIIIKFSVIIDSPILRSCLIKPSIKSTFEVKTLSSPRAKSINWQREFLSWMCYGEFITRSWGNEFEEATVEASIYCANKIIDQGIFLGVDALTKLYLWIGYCDGVWNASLHNLTYP